MGTALVTVQNAVKDKAHLWHKCVGSLISPCKMVLGTFLYWCSIISLPKCLNTVRVCLSKATSSWPWGRQGNEEINGAKGERLDPVRSLPESVSVINLLLEGLRMVQMVAMPLEARGRRVGLGLLVVIKNLLISFH